MATLSETGRRAYQQAQQKEYEGIEKVLPEIDPGKAEAAAEVLANIRKILEKGLHLD